MPYSNFNKNKDRFPWLGQVKLIRPDGQRIIRRKQFKTKKEAMSWEVAERVRLEMEAEAPEPTATISLAKWAESYLDHVKVTNVNSTYVEKQIAFRAFFSFKKVDPETPAANFSPLLALLHLQGQEKKRGGNAANKDRKNLRAAWEWGVRFLDLPEKNPFNRVPRFAEHRNPRRVPTMAEFLQVYNAAVKDQDKLMLWAYLQTGARRDELFRLQWKDVDFAGKRLSRASRKNVAGEWRSAWIPICDELIEMMRHQQMVTGLLRIVFLDQRPLSPQHWKPFQHRQHWLPDLCKAAGVEPFGLHGIRHLTASLLADSDIPMVSIKEMLRHQSMTTTQRYIHSLREGNRDVLTALPSLDNRKEKKREICGK